ncbi:hypothetical protein [Actinocatenispora sera]|uniref:Restriction endonuclease n=1 Tax=Actinocatenispora sera TaxID=390989 RepID=A0A810L9R6_9ACTN|nr:hypothetical protein [Actinocatenispora sera]BCJ32304.1 hypothetical protein Asera_64120 [Actinocatenispora sera]
MTIEFDLGIVPISPRTGTEPIMGADGPTGATLADFWSWSSSDLLGNSLRGVFAEYLVGRALGCVDGAARREWDAVDLATVDGLRVEVKTGAYLQTWPQTGPSVIKFDVARKKSWDYSTNTSAQIASRGADVYVFCVFTARDQPQAVRDDLTLDTSYWDFYIARTARLDTVLGDQQTITLSALVSRVQPQKATYEQLKAAILRAADH